MRKIGRMPNFPAGLSTLTFPAKCELGAGDVSLLRFGSFFAAIAEP
jgi:hypothetical protein